MKCIIFGFLLLVVGAYTTTTKNCDDPNEQYSDCRPCPPLNCGDNFSEMCPFICKDPGCYCKPGYLRQNGKCVPKSQCENCTDPNEQYYHCRPCPPLNCGDNSSGICPLICKDPGCYCKPGYLRQNGKCVPKSQCENCTDPNEQYYHCRPCPPLNCGDNSSGICPLICKDAGCYCKPGYLRKNGKCVPKSQCEICTEPHEEYQHCKPCRPINCGDKPSDVCIAICEKPGCYCKKGYVRRHGLCVPEWYCNDCTGPHEKYYQCKPCLPINCGDETPDICTLICEKPGCYCEKGYVRKNGVCVPKCYCEKCLGPHEKYYPCEPCAPHNCFEVPPKVCSKICKNPGCYCEAGYLRKDGKCVPEECCCEDEY